MRLFLKVAQIPSIFQNAIHFTVRKPLSKIGRPLLEKKKKLSYHSGTQVTGHELCHISDTTSMSADRR